MKPPRKVKLKLIDIPPAFERLVTAKRTPWEVCGRLNDAMRYGHMTLYNHGIAVPVGDLLEQGWAFYVTEVGPGQYDCGVRSPIWFWEPEPLWQVEQNEADAIFAAPIAPGRSPPRPRGRPVQLDWQRVAAEIAYKCHDEDTGRLNVPSNQDKLIHDMLTWCTDTLNVDVAYSTMAEWTSAICSRLKSLRR